MINTLLKVLPKSKGPSTTLPSAIRCPNTDTSTHIQGNTPPESLLNLDLRPLGDSQPHIPPVTNATLDHELGLGFALDSFRLVAAEELDQVSGRCLQDSFGMHIPEADP